MACTWLSISVDLFDPGCDGRALPGCLFAASPSHSFDQLAAAIDTAFGRRVRDDSAQFGLEGRSLVGSAGWDGMLDPRTTRLERLERGSFFTYGSASRDGWLHLCGVGGALVDPLHVLGVVPAAPLPYLWAAVAAPDHYDADPWEDGGPSRP